MDIETLRLALQKASVTALGPRFLAVLIFAFIPIVFASIPVMLAYITKAHEPRRATLLGVAAALGSAWASTIMGRAWAFGLYLPNEYLFII